MAKEITHPITCGLEIHQQLDTQKLFCACPSTIQENNPDYTVKRHLRAVVGETGEIDIAAAEASKKGKTFLYECYDANTCLIELDEEPPRNLREEALAVAIQVGKLAHAHFASEVQVMRKTVIDGSNTSGFQRTALVAYNGKIQTKNGDVTIPTIIVEEDSARLIKEEPDTTTFRLDRLGIPLIEISTGPDIHSPEQCMDVAEKIGLLLRSTGKTKRGLGTIRQDVNVSIPGGTRVEIKGAQELKLIPLLVTTEAARQAKLLEIKKHLEERGVKKVHAQIVDVTTLLAHSASNVIKKTLLSSGCILGIKLSNFAALIGFEIQPGKRLGTEFSERAKAAAGVSGIFHSDELPNYGITLDEKNTLAKHLDLGPKDAFVIVCAPKNRAERALHAVIIRANDALNGVPKEVRRANDDGTTTFLRMMPGAARMYPETDVLPIRLTTELIDSIPIPELIEHKITRYEKLGLAKDLAELCAKSDASALFEKFAQEFKKTKPAYIAEILLTSEPTIRRQYNITISPTDDDFATLFFALEHEEIAKESVLEILKQNKPVKEVISQFKTLTDKELAHKLKKIVEDNKGMPFNGLIGKAMAELRGKANGQKIVEMLKKLAR